jgi:hypothetical protein
MISRFPAFFSSAAFGKVKAACDNRLLVDHHDLVMSDGVSRITKGWNPDMGCKVDGTVLSDHRDLSRMSSTRRGTGGKDGGERFCNTKNNLKLTLY